jgi:hypothetical protein
MQPIVKNVHGSAIDADGDLLISVSLLLSYSPIKLLSLVT